MRLTVFRQKRRIKGKLVISRCYIGRYSLTKGGKAIRVPLNTPDREIARKRLSAIVLEKQRETEGLINSRFILDAAIYPISDHLKDVVAGLQSHESNARHLQN